MIFSKKTASEKPMSDVKLIPILTADQLLNLKNQTWLNKIKNYVQLPEDHFEALYVRLIEQYAAFVQILPATTEGKLGSLLSEGLGRAILALKTIYESDPSKITPNYAYAIFSAALFLNIGQITSTKVTISDAAGRFLEDWLPYQGNLIGRGEYYKIHRYAQVPPHLHRHTATILARQIMPEIGFLWLCEDMRLFYMWLALLNGDRDGVGSLELIFSITPEDIETLWLELKEEQILTQKDLLPRDEFEITLIQEPLLPIDEIEITRPFETQEAENFLEWLKSEIEKGNLPINTPEADITVLHEGVFISMDLFRQFCAAFSSQHYTVVVKAFNHLGLTELSGSDLKFCQYYEKQGMEKKQKIDFKVEDTKRSLGFLQKIMPSSPKTKPVEKQGILLKEKELIFPTEVEVIQNAKIFPIAQPDNLPKLDTALGVEATARIT